MTLAVKLWLAPSFALNFSARPAYKLARKAPRCPPLLLGLVLEKAPTYEPQYLPVCSLLDSCVAVSVGFAARGTFLIVSNI